MTQRNRFQKLVYLSLSLFIAFAVCSPHLNAVSKGTCHSNCMFDCRHGKCPKVEKGGISSNAARESRYRHYCTQMCSDRSTLM